MLPVGRAWAGARSPPAPYSFGKEVAHARPIMARDSLDTTSPHRIPARESAGRGLAEEVAERLRARIAAHREAGSTPFITLTYAQSLDGCIAVRRGRPLALSGWDAQLLTHMLRAAHDAILVGVGTVLSDDPRLTVRLVDGPDPLPIVVDSRARTPTSARLLSHPTRRPVIATTDAAAPEASAALERAGARVVRFPSDPRGRVDLDALLEWLAGEGISSVMVEGGSRVITSFLRARRVDHMIVTVASMLVGGLRAVGPLAARGRDRAWPQRLDRIEAFRLGDDVVVSGTPCWVEP